MGLLRMLKQAPSIKKITDEHDIKSMYRKYRIQAFYSVFLGYALYYICRKNISVALPVLMRDLGYSKTQLGIVLSLFTITYAFAKFVNGTLCDRSNPRYFMALGLAIAAIVNILFGLSNSILFFGIFWMMNGYVQSMGSPVGPKTMANWFSVKERGTYYGTYNTCHSVGAFTILFLGGFIVDAWGWRAGFILPGAFCLLGAAFVAWKMLDRPESVGLPPIEEYHNEVKKGVTDSDETAHETMLYVLWNYVLKNPRIWILSLTCLFIYIVRYGVVDWGTTYLTEVKGNSVGMAGLKVSFLELCGIPGGILAGIASDVIFKGRRIPVAIICMLGVAASALALYLIPKGHGVLDTIALGSAGFFIYGPQMLVAGLAAIDFASRKAAATATGLTGFMSYLGATLAGVLCGWIAQTYGWKGAFTFWIAASLVAALLLTTIIKARARVLEEHYK